MHPTGTGSLSAIRLVLKVRVILWEYILSLLYLPHPDQSQLERVNGPQDEVYLHLASVAVYDLLLLHISFVEWQ